MSMTDGSRDGHVNAPSSTHPAVQSWDTAIDDNDVQRLRDFHAKHFINKPIPDIHASVAQPAEATPTTGSTEGSLGYYADGVRRTLTDDQIKMFRHSEIQRLLLERQQRKEAEEEETQRRERKREREHARQRYFDEPEKDNVGALVYDDEQPVARQDANAAQAEKKFLWPQLGV
ncbi:uncharacterized protein AB675_2815 [Cyphellophora attinorum]|uniref:Uncharacterized protein n=1 Tax=Cyphellophora attinorum TaxID=1664694 RepID=A0A0N1P3J6_9EURO|nr:uncharacterized protein AB675_2815 [Phialophora attinorum]KPI45302.1 hypothetical protein AB675_2815 [Phialophora attinorum]